MSPDSLHAVATAAADTSRPFFDFMFGAGAGSTREQTSHFLEGWHEFFLLSGTAAVTLVGLLFVSLSFNLDVLIHESKAHVLAYARATLLTFSYVLVVSLMVLIPNQGVRPLGMMITVASTILGTLHMKSFLRRPSAAPTPFERSMRRRSMIYLFAYGLALVSGAGMFVTRVPELLFNMISVICLMLGNAMGVSWDLLVEVGKLKAEMTRPGGSSGPPGR